MRYVIASLLFLGFGCLSSTPLLPSDPPPARGSFDSELTVEEGVRGGGSGEVAVEPVLPINGQLIYKGFGEYFEDRFSGYHVAIDFEAPADTPVYAAEEGEVTYSGWVAGYGGVMVVKTIMFDLPPIARRATGGLTRSYIYGHLDPASLRVVGETVEEGGQLGVLGEKGEETDGEREHLHFAMYEGGEVRLQGYETDSSAVDSWLNPIDYVRPVPHSSQSDGGSDKMSRAASELIYDGREIFELEFEVPAGWDVEYIPSIQSLNLYTLAGEGSARERSQILIRYFDASSFLTLSTVTIHSVENLVVGTGDYTARRYDIQKNAGVADFVDQPSWRNDRHIVTDFRGADGFTRYYVVAANPTLDTAVYERILASMVVE